MRNNTSWACKKVLTLMRWFGDRDGFLKKHYCAYKHYCTYTLLYQAYIHSYMHSFILTCTYTHSTYIHAFIQNLTRYAFSQCAHWAFSQAYSEFKDVLKPFVYWLVMHFEHLTKVWLAFLFETEVLLYLKP